VLTGVIMRITRADGLITVAQAAKLCGVKPRAVRQWITRGYWSDVLQERLYLPEAKREGSLILLNPVEVQKAEHATAVRARRCIVPTATAEAAA
jgi:phage antirepressor YoqD-like protein